MTDAEMLVAAEKLLGYNGQEMAEKLKTHPVNYYQMRSGSRPVGPSVRLRLLNLTADKYAGADEEYCSLMRAIVKGNE